MTWLVGGGILWGLLWTLAALWWKDQRDTYKDQRDSQRLVSQGLRDQVNELKREASEERGRRDREAQIILTQYRKLRSRVAELAKTDPELAGKYLDGVLSDAKDGGDAQPPVLGRAAANGKAGGNGKGS